MIKYILAISLVITLLLLGKMTLDAKNHSDELKQINKQIKESYEKRWKDIKQKEDNEKYLDINTSIGKHTITIGLLTKAYIR